MSLTRLTEDLNIHQKLEDEPNDVGGLSAQELKKKFDQAGLAIQKYLNETHLPEEEKAVSDALSQAKAYADKKAENLGQGDMKMNLYDTQKRRRDIFDYVDERIREAQAAKPAGGCFTCAGTSPLVAVGGKKLEVNQFNSLVDPNGLWCEDEQAFLAPEGARMMVATVRLDWKRTGNGMCYLRVMVNDAWKDDRSGPHENAGEVVECTVMLTVPVKGGDRVKLIMESYTPGGGGAQVDIKDVRVDFIA